MRKRTFIRRGALSAALAIGFGLFGASVARAQPQLERAFAFGSRNLTCATASDPGVNYTMIHHAGDNLASHDALAYPMTAEALSYGYESLYSLDPLDANYTPYADNNRELDGSAQFGPLDDSPNNRGQFPDVCPDQLYDSFIGGKNFLSPCVPDPLDPLSVDVPCGLHASDPDPDPEGIIFRVDVPNGRYRFAAAVGSPDNAHSNRILVEDGGSGPPQNITQNHVVLVNNHDAAVYGPNPRVIARVGFGCFLPPQAGSVTFLNMDEEGFPAVGPDLTPLTPDDDPPDSPTLEVTQGYLRVHQLQGRSSDDANGGNMIILEIWRVDVPGGDQVGNGQYVDGSRSFGAGAFDPAGKLDVTIDLLGVVGPTDVVDTLPAGWTVAAGDEGGGSYDSGANTMTFANVQSDGPLTYTATAPSDPCGPAPTFSATITPDGGCPSSASASIPCNPPDCSVQFTGGVSDMLIIGPIELGQSASANGNCNDADGLGNDFSTKDYLVDADGENGEASILVRENDELFPDFGFNAGGVGVFIWDGLNDVNPNINPSGDVGVLTVWKADADQNGYINFNDADNIGIDVGGGNDTVIDYIAFGLVYLENNTGACLDTILEVGSDDAVKMRVNGQLVHANAVCRGVPGYGGGDMVPVTLAPGKNIVLIGVVERAGGTGVRLVVRDTAGDPISDGRVTSSCEPPASYPPFAAVTRAIDPASFKPGDTITVTLTPSGITGQTTIVETFPDGFTVVSNGGGQEQGNTLTFTVSTDDPIVYTVQLPVGDGTCPFETGSFSGTVTPTEGCAALSGDSVVGCVAPPCPVSPTVFDEYELVEAFAFGSRDLQCATFNVPSVNYTMVLQVGGDPLSVEYTPAKGFGYERIYDLLDPFNPPIHSTRGGWEEYGAFDDSPNGRNDYPDECPEELYDSFIGGKNWFSGQGACTQDIVIPPDPDLPCAEGLNVLTGQPMDPEGIIFRVDVPNGTYRFVGAYGDTDNVHAHRIIAEDGGEGPPTELGPNHVVLVHNFDQAQQTVGQVTPAEPGEGVFARVGFDGLVPPIGDGIDPSPQFVNMGEDGRETDPGADLILGTSDDECPNSPTLVVTQGYIRIHQLQANSNDGPGGDRDPNGGDAVILELWRQKVVVGDRIVRGDADSSGRINLTDGVQILNWLFLGGPEPACLDAADTDDTGTINLTDAVRIFNWLFTGGPAPVTPSPSVAEYSTEDCGIDDTPDADGGDLGCATKADKCS